MMKQISKLSVRRLFKKQTRGQKKIVKKYMRHIFRNSLSGESIILITEPPQLPTGNLNCGRNTSAHT